MKKLVSIIIAAALLISMTSCAAQRRDPAQTTEAGSTGVQTSGTSASEETTSPAPVIQGEVIAQGRYGLTNIFDGISGEMTDMKICGSCIAAVFSDYDSSEAVLACYDVYTGKTSTRTVEVKYGTARIYSFAGDSFALYADNSWFEMCSSPSGEPTARFTLPEMTDPETQSFYFTVADAENILKIDGARVTVYDFSGAEKLTVDMSAEFDYPYFKTIVGDTLVFGGYSTDQGAETTVCVDLGSGEYKMSAGESSLSFFGSNGISAAKEDKSASLYIYTSGSLDLSSCLRLESSSEYIIDAGGDKIATCSYSGSEAEPGCTVRLYSMLTGELLLRERVLQNNSRISLSGNGSLLIIYAAEPDGPESWTLIDTRTLAAILRNPETPSDTAKNLKAKLESKYGVIISVADEAIQYFPDFAALPLYDEDTIVKTLQALDGIFGKLPEGFIQELLDGRAEYSMTSYKICITGRLLRGSSVSTSSPIAYAYQDYDTMTQYMVVDGTSWSSLETTISHELMHAVDSKISHLESDGISKGFADWDKYTPKGFSYNWSYVDEYGNDYSDWKYCAPYDVNGIWFIDAYSKTFPTEDRSRLFENLFCGNASYFADNPHINARAAYLCEVIKENFDCVKNADSVYWERYLQN